MNIQLNPELEASAHAFVNAGRYSSIDAVVAEGMRLVQIREQKLASLRAEIQDALAEDKWVTDEEMGAHIAGLSAQAKAMGY